MKMRKSFFSLLVLIMFVGFTALPYAVLGQETPAPPKPLDDDMIKWMVGEWEGWSESPMGKTKEWMSCQIGLDGQFMLMSGKSEAQGQVYKGMGCLTIDPKTGELVGLWIDNWRGMYKGKGKREGNKTIMEWVGTMGKSTRITEKINEDKFVETVKLPGPDGKMTTMKAEYTRVKKMKK